MRRNPNPPQCDHAAVLAMVREGKPYPEVAAAAGAPVVTIRSIVCRARKRGEDVGPYRPGRRARRRIPLPGGHRHPLYRKFRDLGYDRDAAIDAAGGA